MPADTVRDEKYAPYSEFYAKLGRRICSVRKAKGWSFAQVEEFSDGRFTRSVLMSWERGLRRPHLEHLMELAEFYGVDYEVFLPVPPGGQTLISAEDVINRIRDIARMGEEDAAPPAIPSPRDHREQDEPEDAPEVHGA
jgi:transcriptional regulator with XRE-family HTH domain